MGKQVKKTRNKPTENLGEYAVNGGPGRPAGSKNKTGREALQEVLDTLAALNAAKDERGNPKYPRGYLYWLAEAQPRTFAALLGRCLPRDMKVEGAIHTTWEDMVRQWNKGPDKRR